MLCRNDFMSRKIINSILIGSATAANTGAILLIIATHLTTISLAQMSHICWKPKEAFARYRFMNDELVYCGMFTGLGFEDIPAGQIFPTAKHTATIKYKISEEDRTMSVFDRTLTIHSSKPARMLH